jgi:hypothetical protein
MPADSTGLRLSFAMNFDGPNRYRFMPIESKVNARITASIASRCSVRHA